jgi:hypothetical protein
MLASGEQGFNVVPIIFSISLITSKSDMVLSYQPVF